MNLADSVVRILEKKMYVDDWRVISLGCGIGLGETNPKWSHLTGVDIYDYSGAAFHEFYHYDVRKVRQIIADKTYDLVLCLDIIEHLEKQEGFQLIKDAEAIAKQVVVFYTPYEWDDNEIAFTDKFRWTYGNPYQKHKSLWSPDEFKDYVIYKVFLQIEKSDGYLAVKWL